MATLAIFRPRRIARWKYWLRHSGRLRTVTCAASTSKKRSIELPDHKAHSALRPRRDPEGSRRLRVSPLRSEFLGGRLRNRRGRPDLAMRMRIAGAHHGAAVFEDLYVVDVFQAGQFPKLSDPCVDDQLNLIPRHRGQGEIVTWGKANHTANPRLGFGDQQAHAVDVEASVGGLWFQGGEIVLEDEGRGVRRIVNPAGPGVSGAKVASRVVGGLGRGLELRYFSLPGTRGAMGRDQHPFVGQRIQSAMRIFGEFQID